MKKKILLQCVVIVFLLYLFGCEKNQLPAENDVSETRVPDVSDSDTSGEIDSENAIVWPRYGLISDYNLYRDKGKSRLYHLVYQEREYSDLIELKEVTVNGSVSIVGEWGNKLYLNDGESIFYYDLTEEPLKAHKWIVPPTEGEYREFEKKYMYLSHTGELSTNTLAFKNDSLNFKMLGAPYECSFANAILVDDDLFFDFNFRSWGLGILSINLNDNNILDAKSIAPHADFQWEFDRKSGLIYYIEFNNSYDIEEWHSLWTYDVSTEQKQKINNAADFIINGDGTILCSTNYFKNLYLYNIKTKEEVLITDNAESCSNSFWSTAYYLNGSVYFHRKNQILRWCDGKTDVFYTVPDEVLEDDEHDAVYLYGFVLYDENTICLILQYVPNVWLVNGQIQADPPQFENDVILLKLLNGRTITVTAWDIDFPA